MKGQVTKDAISMHNPQKINRLLFLFGSQPSLRVKKSAQTVSCVEESIKNSDKHSLSCQSFLCKLPVCEVVASSTSCPLPS